MNEKKKFLWLSSPTYTRSFGSSFYHLESGKEYDAALFPLEVVEEWVRTGAAEWVLKKAKNSDLEGGK